MKNIKSLLRICLGFGLSYIVSLFMIAPAFASYDEHCLRLLTKSESQALAFERFRNQWEPAIIQAVELGRPLTSVEYEAFMDLGHSLPVIAILQSLYDGNDELALSPGKGILELSERLAQADLIAIKYPPETLMKLGEMYKNACEVLNRPGCEGYVEYQGLNVAGERPFTPGQEQALKWSTFHMIQSETLGQVYQNFKLSEVEIVRFHNELKESRQRSALEILATSFSPDEAARLYSGFIGPFIQAAFEKSFRIYKGQGPN